MAVFFIAATIPYASALNVIVPELTMKAHPALHQRPKLILDCCCLTRNNAFNSDGCYTDLLTLLCIVTNFIWALFTSFLFF
jgi:hypothetical protein